MVGVPGFGAFGSDRGSGNPNGPSVSLDQIYSALTAIAQSINSNGESLQAILEALNAHPYPDGAVPINACSGNRSNATATATIPALDGYTAYLAGIYINGAGATAANVVTCAVSGLVGATMTLGVAVPAGVNAPLTPILLTFANPIPASAQNLAISAVMGAFGAGGLSATINTWGYYLP